MVNTPDEPYLTVHVFQTDNGHVNALDCWCEPNLEMWQRNAVGSLLRLIHHTDYTFMHRKDILALRTKKPGWITELLSYVGTIGFSDA